MGRLTTKMQTIEPESVDVMNQPLPLGNTPVAPSFFTRKLQAWMNIPTACCSFNF